jgi:hypothetical protein
LKSFIITSLTLILIILLQYHISFSSEVFQDGEKLVYNVSYFGIDIGKVEVESICKEKINEKDTYKTITKIDTYNDIPFVDFHVIYREWMDVSFHYSHKFITNTFYAKDDWGYGEINFDYEKNYINIKSWRHDEIEFDKHFQTEKKYCNGLTLIFIMRQHAHDRKTLKVPALLNNDTTYAWLNLSGKKEDVFVDAFNKKASCYKAGGKIDMTGLYGLAGDFEVWITADEKRIPVYAKVNIILGSAILELIEIKR